MNISPIISRQTYQYTFGGKKHNTPNQSLNCDDFCRQKTLYTNEHKLSGIKHKNLFLKPDLKEMISGKLPIRRYIENSKASSVLGDKSIQARFKNCDINSIGNFHEVIIDTAANKIKWIADTNKVILYEGCGENNFGSEIDKIESDEVLIYDLNNAKTQIGTIKTKMFDSKSASKHPGSENIHIKKLEITDGFINPSFNYHDYKYGAVNVEGLSVDELKSSTLKSNKSKIKKATVTGKNAYCLISNSQIETLKTSNIEALEHSHIKNLIIPKGTTAVNIPLGAKSVIDNIICEDPKGCKVKLFHKDLYYGYNIKIKNGEIIHLY